MGSLLGLLSSHIGMIPLELGIGGGVLVAALFIGWYNSRHPEIVALPPAAQWTFSEFGLTALGAVVGLLAGHAAFAAMKDQGLALLLCGAVVTLLPPLVALYFGRYVLRLHPNDPIRCLGRGTGRSCVDEQDHRTVRQQYAGDRFYWVLCDFQRAVSGLRADYRFCDGGVELFTLIRRKTGCILNVCNCMIRVLGTLPVFLPACSGVPG